MLRRIYYIEDDPVIGNMIKDSLETLNDVYPVKVELFENYESFKIALDKEMPSLIMIDLTLPTKSGFEILKEVKATRKYEDVPVIIVSAKPSEYDRYICLEEGAIAYFTKPFFGLMELNSAIKNFMKIPKNDKVLICGDLALDRTINSATRKGELLDLSPKEFELLRYFIVNNNVPLSKEDIYYKVWNEEYKKSRTLDMHIKFLRQKVFNDDPKVIQTITKFGYKFVYDTE